MGKKILIIEDELSLANALKLKLSSVSYEVEIAENGRIGIDRLKADKYDLVLLDLILPELDGFGVLTELKSWKTKPPVLVLSNLSQEEDIQRVKDMGAVDFFVKSDIELFKIVDYINAFFEPK
jgi:DNA-binding response OmpR family regulator